MRDRTDGFDADMQRYIAVTTVGPSTLRNQGGPGVIAAAQCFLSELPISTFAVKDEKSFLAVLDTTTEELRRRLPPGSRHWGAARKALNLFLRDICYNGTLCRRHFLTRLEPWMEIPLDRLVAIALKRQAGERVLPGWPGLKGLTPAVSVRFQHAARDWASTEGISRVHLDMRIWIVQRT